MNVGVLGLWHLGTVTAACLASTGAHVRGWDADATVVGQLSAGVPPLFEPGLEALVKQGLAAGRLQFTSDVAAAVGGADIVWVTIDTPVDDDDCADVESVVRQVAAAFSALPDGALVLVSSQLPVGTTRRLAGMCAAQEGRRRVTFAYVPENLRLGQAIDALTRPDRIVVGLESGADRDRVAALLRPWTSRIEWMSVESAEMVKHALNAFLATSVAFINEVAGICEAVGADASDVARALKSESRVGPRAYLSPGAAFAGGTLARDIQFLAEVSSARGLDAHLLRAVRSSNEAHRHWAGRRLETLLGDVAGKAVAVWGLTYKPGTDTLRRSAALELCRWLAGRGASVRVHDPAVRALPAGEPGGIEQHADALSAAAGASALVVATPWPEYRDVPAARLADSMARPLVLDATRHLAATLGVHPRIEYVTVGAVRA